MNSTLAAERTNVAPTGLDELLTFVGLPSKRSAQELSGVAETLFQGISQVLDGFLLRAIDKRTATGFMTARKEVFGDYFKLITALSNVARVIVPKLAVQRLVNESFSELEAEFRDQGLNRFGSVAKDQAMFTVWTLRKISGLATQIAESSPVREELKEQDRAIANEFAFYAGWTHFHLDCMMASIRFDRAITPEVLDVVCDGLRAAVNAYGLIRQGVDLRIQSPEPTIAAYTWDEEDQELLEASMSDMESEVI